MSDQSSGRSSADRGLGGLGLIMQLGGTIFAAFTAMIIFYGLIMMGRMRGGAGEGFLYLLLLGGTGLARSIIHRNAGADLCFATMSPFAGIRKYFSISAANTACWFLVMAGRAHAPAWTWIVLVCMLMAWPTALLVMSKMPGFREMDAQRVPVGPDKGFEGASLLMLAIGLMGVALSGAMLYMAFKMVTMRGAPGSMVLILVAAAVLFIRAILHVAAGLRGVRETYVDRVVEAANRYANFGVIAAFVTGGAMLMMFMTVAPDPTILIVVGCLTWMLLAWPLAIRRFFSERQFADMMAGVDPSAHVRAPDMGMQSLGWLLFAQALISLACSLPALLLGHSELFNGMGGGGGGMSSGMDQLGQMMTMITPEQGHSPWWSIGIWAAEMWAAIELIRMSELNRIAATAFGGIVTAVTLYMNWPALTHLSEIMREGPMAVMFFAKLASSLAIPLTVLFAANRNPLPAATARIAPPSPPGQPGPY